MLQATEDLGMAMGSPDPCVQSFDGISTVFTVSPGPTANDRDGQRMPSVAEDSCIDGILARGFHRGRVFYHFHL